MNIPPNILIRLAVASVLTATVVRVSAEEQSTTDSQLTNENPSQKETPAPVPDDRGHQIGLDDARRTPDPWPDDVGRPLDLRVPDHLRRLFENRSAEPCPACGMG